MERIYADQPDPWQLSTSEYERAKYDATLGALDAARSWARVLEVGCAKGVFGALLAPRCGELVAIDFSSHAVLAARLALAATPNVTVLRRTFPEQVPPGTWSLIVCSEVLYYLDADALEVALAWLDRALRAGATLVAVHWRGPGLTEPLRGDDVHDAMLARFGRWHALDARAER